MRQLATVLARELTEKGDLLLAAAVAALVPLLVPLVPSLGRLGREDVRVAVALIMGCGLAAVAAYPL